MSNKIRNVRHCVGLLTIYCAFVLLGAGSALADDANSIRVISTDNSSTTLVLALDAEETLVGIDSTSVLPSRRPEVAVVGYHRALSAEGLLALTPSVVIGNENMGPPETLAILRQAGVDITQLNNPKTPAELKDNIQLLAGQLDRVSQGEVLLEKLDSQLASLGSNLPTEGMKVAFFLSVAGNRLRMAGAGTGADALIQLLGAKNAADYKNYRSLSAEAILALQPDLILVTGEDEESTATQFVAANKVLANTPAGISGRVFGIDSAAVISGVGLVSIEEALRVSMLVSKTGPLSANNP